MDTMCSTWGWLSICPGDDSELRAGAVRIRLILSTLGSLKYRGLPTQVSKRLVVQGLITSMLGGALLLVTLSPPWGGRKEREREGIPTGKVLCKRVKASRRRLRFASCQEF